MKHEHITQQCIRSFYAVYNKLGYGFLEKVYEQALLIEMQKLGLHGQTQVPLKVWYDNKLVGSYFADVIVEDLVIIELKATVTLSPEHEAQLINYLRATDIEVGLLFNFGKRPEFKRKVFQNFFKEVLKPEIIDESE